MGEGIEMGDSDDEDSSSDDDDKKVAQVKIASLSLKMVRIMKEFTISGTLPLGFRSLIHLPENRNLVIKER